MADVISCLYRLGDKKDVVALEDCRKVTCGRAEGNDLVLDESPAVSRQHAEFSLNDNEEWTILDKKSGNGVYVNGEKIVPSVPRVLKDRDKIEIGKDPTGVQATAYIFRYYKKARVNVKRASEKADSSLESAAKKQKCEENEALARQLEELEKKMKDKDEEQEKLAKMLEDFAGEKQKLEEEVELEKAMKLSEAEKRTEEMALHSKRYEEALAEQKALKEAMDEREKKFQEEMEVTKGKMSEELEEELEKQKSEHAAERTRLEEEMHEKLLVELATQGEDLQKMFQQEMTQLNNNKEKLEEKLQEEMYKKLGEKDKDHEAQLSREKEALSDIISAKEAQQTTLLAELQQQKEEIEKAKQNAKAAKAQEAILQNVEELTDEEFMCCICSEIFIQAVSLGCSHSFCSLCIEQWKAKKNECPQCRQKISFTVRSRVVDNYIEKVMELMSPELKEKRKVVLEERKAEQAQYEIQKKSKTATVAVNVPNPPRAHAANVPNPPRAHAANVQNPARAHPTNVWAEQLRQARQAQNARYQPDPNFARQLGGQGRARNQHTINPWQAGGNTMPGAANARPITTPRPAAANVRATATPRQAAATVRPATTPRQAAAIIRPATTPRQAAAIIRPATTPRQAAANTRPQVATTRQTRSPATNVRTAAANSRPAAAAARPAAAASRPVAAATRTVTSATISSTPVVYATTSNSTATTANNMSLLHPTATTTQNYSYAVPVQAGAATSYVVYNTAGQPLDYSQIVQQLAGGQVRLQP